MSRCVEDIGLARLVDYLARELPEAESDALEEHFFECDACTRDLEEIAQIGSGVSRLLRGGLVPVVLTEAMDARLSTAGVNVREFRVVPGGTTPCAAALHDDLLAVCLEADLDDVERARLRMTDQGGLLDVVHEDIPLQRRQGAVRVGYPAALIRTLPDSIVHLVLDLEDSSGRRRSQKYRLLHSAARL